MLAWRFLTMWLIASLCGYAAAQIDNSANPEEVAERARDAERLVAEFFPDDPDGLQPLAERPGIDPERLYRQDLAFRLLLRHPELQGQQLRDAIIRGGSAPEIWHDPVFLRNRARYLESLRAERVTPLITGGTEDCGPANVEFRNVVGVTQVSGPGSGLIICGGVVLTTKHAVLYPSERTWVVLDCDSNQRVLAEKVVHYTPDPKDPNDKDIELALVFLPKNSRVQVAEKNRFASSDEFAKSCEVMAVGFGSNDVGGGGAPRRRVGKGMTIYSYDCNCGLPQTEPRCIECCEFLSSSGIRSDDGSVIDICTGDSGGPAYVKVNDEWMVAGVTRRSRETADGKPCGAGGIFTRTDSDRARAWIVKQLNLHGVTCDPFQQ